ncbi:Ribosomal large subunit pseudouridine synthase E, partial [Haemophilus influenzae]
MMLQIFQNRNLIQ